MTVAAPTPSQNPKPAQDPALVLNPPVSSAPATRWRRRGPRAANEGAALVARGEPLVWLTCGALALILMMIAGLVSLIVSEGVQTFWPQPVVRLTLTDGKIVAGEVAREEEYGATAEQIAALLADRAAALTSTSVEGKPPRVRRRLVRVGNFEITQEHFRWVSDLDLPSRAAEPSAAESGGNESLPEWAVVLERVQWGRFYGEPAAYIVRRPRPVSGEEEQLAGLIAFFEQHLTRLEEPSQKAVEAALQPLRDSLATLRQQSGAALVDAARREDRPDGGLVELALADGAWKPLNEAPADDESLNTNVVQEIREIWNEPDAAWREFERRHPRVVERFRQQVRLEKHDLGEINRLANESRKSVKAAELATGAALMAQVEQEKSLRDEVAALRRQEEELRRIAETAARKHAGTALAEAAKTIVESLATEFAAALAEPEARLKQIEASHAGLPESARAALAAYFEAQARAAQDSERVTSEINAIKAENELRILRMTTFDGQTAELKPADIVLGYRANRLSFGAKLGVYLERWREFLMDDPREANSEGGVFPAIWGTVAMTLIMSLTVVPFGVLAALYLREYARRGVIVAAIRVAVNNLAGVPSIVFGVFGMGFFCYLVGAYVDGGPSNAGLSPWPPARWFLALGSLAAIAFLAFLAGLLSMSTRKAEAAWWKVWLRRGALVAWIGATALVVVLVAKTPFFDGFHRTNLPNPTYGKGGLIWASLTLALMTLPVVIVATEEALSAVPNSMREGSYACGAGKWQTIARIVLPRALPGIMTGMILAMARGAGEVAPLMLVGAVKLAPELPLDLTWPFLHPDRSFMHLGFHIYDLGFQSQNSEAAKPMVFTTTLLLIAIIGGLNLAAIWLRSRLRSRYKATQF